MFNEFKKGMVRGIGTLIIVGGGLFAFQVTGTIKTWTTGDTLTAADLNTTVQSLKSAIESAGAIQVGNIFFTQAMPSPYYTQSLFTTGNTGGDESRAVAMPRGGIVRSASLRVFDSVGTCSVTLRKGAADTGISFSVPITTDVTQTDADTVTFVAGDILDWKYDCAGANFKGVLTFEISWN